MNPTISIFPNGRSGERIHRLLDPVALKYLPEQHYWALLQVVLDDLQSNALGSMTPHEHAFAKFCLLAQSVLGGVCWPRSERWLSQLTFDDIAEVVSNNLAGQSFLIEIRKNLSYPILIQDSVVFTLLQLIIQVMSKNPLRNQGLRPIPDEIPIAPGIRNGPSAGN